MGSFHAHRINDKVKTYLAGLDMESCAHLADDRWPSELALFLCLVRWEYGSSKLL